MTSSYPSHFHGKIFFKPKTFSKASILWFSKAFEGLLFYKAAGLSSVPLHSIYCAAIVSRKHHGTLMGEESKKANSVSVLLSK